MHIVIIIPTYNESASLQQLFPKLKLALQETPQHKISVLIFDSQSKDDTQSLVRTWQQDWPGLLLRTEPQKSGLGSAYIQAMHIAMNELNADAVMEYDADGSHQPKYIKDLIHALEKGADVAVGSRYVKGGRVDVDWPFHRKLLSVGGNLLSRLVLSPRFKDYTSGFRLTKTSSLRRIDLNKLLSKQYGYKLHLFWWLHKTGAKIVEVPITFKDRELGQSKLPAGNVIESLRIVFTLRYRELKRYIYMCLCGGLGSALQIVVFNILRGKLGSVPANAVAIELAIILNFFSNNYLSFRDRRVRTSHGLATWSKKMLNYNIFSLIGMGIQLAILTTGQHLFGKGHMTANLLVILGIFLGSIFNYILFTKRVWRHS